MTDAGRISGKKVSECELASEVLKISRAKGEKSLAMLVQSSIKITVKVLSVVLEESSKRYVITFRQLGEDSDETIRSERTDGRRGKDVMQLWGRDLKNHICISPLESISSGYCSRTFMISCSSR